MEAIKKNKEEENKEGKIWKGGRKGEIKNGKHGEIGRNEVIRYGGDKGRERRKIRDKEYREK